MADRSASLAELGPIRTAAQRYDVAILGGGLAGLTLAIQLKQRQPETSVLVLEKREGPAPLAAFKVGESTVRSGAHYFAETVGLRDHLEGEQLRKMGLRFFGPAGDNSDITRRVEWGPPVWPPAVSYQLDRGLFENELATRVRGMGADLLQGCRVGAIELGSDQHTVTFQQAGRATSTQARWVVDAGGRASLLKRQLGMATTVGHTINSAWFRLRGGLDFEQWGRDHPDWMARMFEPGNRMYSTNHLLGEGYWVWLIPLSSGPISIGICADPRYHPFDQINDFDRMMDWLRSHEPQLAAAVEPRIADIEDFLRIEDFAYGVERMLSPERWCLVGEAAAFADPYLSPGSDMIAFSNTFSSDVISRDLTGEDVSDRIEYFDDLYHRIFESVLARTEDLYPVFGNPLVMAVKHSWDGWIGHCGYVLIFSKALLTDLEFMKSVEADLDRLLRLNITIHRLFREWHDLEPSEWENDIGKPAFVTPIREGFDAPLLDYTDDELRAAVQKHVRDGEAMCVAIFFRAVKGLSESPDEDTAVNPYAVSLRPQDWEAEGLYEQPGLTLAEAREVVEGVDWLFLDYKPAEA